MKSRTLLIAVAAILVAALTRIIPHPANFAPMTAMALFAGAVIANRRLALITPLVALLASDLVIEVLHRMHLISSWGIYRGMVIVYPTMLLVGLLGMTLYGRRRTELVAGATLAGSVLFFLATNFGVWLLGEGTTYAHNWTGLVECYVAALPFFRNALAGDVIYATALFGGFALAERYVPALHPAAEPVAVQA